jgi:hypothetical protein
MFRGAASPGPLYFRMQHELPAPPEANAILFFPRSARLRNCLVARAVLIVLLEWINWFLGSLFSV